jgi:leucyl-tRNA synthetase
MSKSKCNTVAPAAIVARYGADTARWFLLSDNPPERDMEWTEAGVQACARFVQRLVRLAGAIAVTPVEDAPAQVGPVGQGLRRALHRTIAAVTEALEGFAFNVAVARVHEFANTLADAEKAAEPGMAVALREAAGVLARLVAPLIPHTAEQMHALLEPESGELVAQMAWPMADPDLLAAEQVTIAVQVMGKLRGTITVTPEATAEAVLLAAEGEPNVARLLAGQRIVKRIHVPGRIVNFVIAGAA